MEVLRITPARAGKRQRRGQAMAKHRNYPRSRGEEIPDHARGGAEWELPPLARGREKISVRAARQAGITPARAGKRRQAKPLPYKHWNYPRSRGEE